MVYCEQIFYMHCAVSAGAFAAADDAESNQYTWEGQCFLSSLILTAELSVTTWDVLGPNYHVAILQMCKKERLGQTQFDFTLYMYNVQTCFAQVMGHIWICYKNHCQITSVFGGISYKAEISVFHIWLFSLAC